MTQVEIEIVTTQFVIDDPFVSPETVTTRVKGAFWKDGEGQKLTYEEPEEAGLGKCRTTLTVSADGRVTILRQGQTQSRMTVETGVRHDCRYLTEVMPFSLATEGTGERHTDFGAPPFELKLSYLLYVDGKAGFRNLLHLTAKPI